MDYSDHQVVGHLVTAVGIMCILIGAVTVLNLEYLFTATVPLFTVGIVLALVPYDERFEEFMTTGELLNGRILFM